MMSNPLPSSPSLAASAMATSSADTGAESLPRSPKPSNGPWTRRPGNPAGTSQSVLMPRSASNRPGRPHVRRRSGRRRHPAFPRVQNDPIAVPFRGAEGSPEMAARSRFAERQRAQVRTARGRLADLARPECLEHGGAAIVHAGHHRGRTALLCKSSDDGGGAAEAETEPADIRRTDGTHQAGGSQGIQPWFGKGALLIDMRSAGTDGFRCRPVPTRQNIRRSLETCSPRQRPPRQACASAALRRRWESVARSLRALAEFNKGRAYSRLQSSPNVITS